MTPLQMSAQFAAYTWFVRQPDNAHLSREEAHQYARLYWERFLPLADEGFGRLLMRMAKIRKRRSRRPVLAG